MMRCKALTEESDTYKRERNFYKNKYNTLHSIIFGENFHSIAAVCIIDRKEYIIYTTKFTHQYKPSFYCKYASFFEMNFVMEHLSHPSHSKSNQVASAQIEIKDKSLEIVNLDSYCFRCGYGSKLFEYIEKYARANELEKIWGKIYIHTPIGLENLIRFYEKQGCIVYKENYDLKFKKVLNENL